MLLNIYVETMIIFNYSLMDRKLLFEIISFCNNNIKVFTVTFDQLNAFLLNKSINFIFKKILLNPNFWAIV